MKKILSIFIVILLFAVGCGQQKEEKKETKADNKNQAITIKHAEGETKLDKPAKKVVVLEWVYSEDLLALGVQPVGMADIKNYNKWVNTKTKPSKDVVDVGTRQQPNLEEISRLKPDLIITASFRGKAIKNELEQIAPTVMFDPSTSNNDHFAEMTETFKQISKAVGKEEEGKKVLADMDKAFADAKAKIEKADLKDKNIAMAQAFTAKNVPTFRILTDNSLALQVTKKLGLTNTFEAGKSEPDGFKQTTVESLQSVQDSNFIYIVADEDNIFDTQLKGNPAWEELKFKKENKMYKLKGDTWIFGGPESATSLATQVADVMTAKK
ncbi:TPA: iron-siderophore ABC transporter substrate-binding protein [Bacillus cereus]|uniref:Ferrichrome ABC transporter substrate-binding protein n=1 Tax=Bacillus thuringiensis serovar kumamotoensis TaxID=132267 RepID=A0A9X6PPB9_BACUK|nr:MULTISPECIES: iron-siderophore ABC transporter substrate-binding protein [Bacillus]EKS7845409.1 iron-siderophore ABC transporter substrate-binding protein [Bacillus cereus]MCU5665166.1 iron-siderophore ABC transporter substrate-binding protein [Bacillus cereus]MDA2608836.1 iron-siderophore ABC transporter substrate-binding protein [Bacillus cereus]MEB2643923.1 iron-siderophore ABC transporter substrate-binding protein [Bacillus sp. DAG6]MEC2869045.1 iron-siderophore ABC transporter substrat